jgi:hypothetical protein
MKARVDERWVNTERLLQPSAKSYKEQHLSAVRNIADEYFYFPTPEYAHLRAFVNEPDVEQRIFTNYGHELAPNIVVLEWPESSRDGGRSPDPSMITNANAEMGRTSGSRE